MPSTPAKPSAPTIDDALASLEAAFDAAGPPLPGVDRLPPSALAVRPSRHRPARANHPTPTQVGRRGAMLAMGASLGLASSCAWILHPERRHNHGAHGHIDVIPLVVDILWFLPGLIPGIICLAVDFASGAIFVSHGADEDTSGEALAKGSAPTHNQTRSHNRAALAYAPRTEPAPDQLEVHGDSRLMLRARGDADRHPLVVSTAHARGRREQRRFEREAAAEPARLTLDAPRAGEDMELELQVGRIAKHRIRVRAPA